ncbi:hypothetical protein [Citrobacter freundii]|uniref:hypothetical protein n=1 Tax=Citrobacter freundii TaxID=546 RepID=UPI0008FD18F2|nr:hypothetical protein [Citrobacter freundii]OIY13592.1 hypothetical protein BED44_17935 [Citrobacter freundii]
MSNGKVIQIRQARPDAEEMKYFWKLYSAAQRVEDRWCTNTVPGIADALADTELSREEKLFLLRAWQVLVDDRGGFGRHLGALDTYIHNIQDPNDGCVGYKPELKACLEDGLLFDVMFEAYAEAKTRIAELEAREVTLPAEKFCPSEYAGSQYWEETEVWNKAISACSVAISAAGIGVKG